MNISIAPTATAYTIADASGVALILGSSTYDFTCTPGATLALAASVDSRYVSGGTLFPRYGVFILNSIPPATDLFTLFLPDVQITTAIQHDTLFHTFTGTNTIAKPTGLKTIVFAIAPDSAGTSTLTPSNYEYKNFAITAATTDCGGTPRPVAQASSGPSALIGAAATGHLFRYSPKSFGDVYNNPTRTP